MSVHVCVSKRVHSQLKNIFLHENSIQGAPLKVTTDTQVVWER